MDLQEFGTDFSEIALQGLKDTEVHSSDEDRCGEDEIDEMSWSPLDPQHPIYSNQVEAFLGRNGFANKAEFWKDARTRWPLPG